MDLQAKRWGFAALLNKGKENVVPQKASAIAEYTTIPNSLLPEQQNRNRHPTEQILQIQPSDSADTAPEHQNQSFELNYEPLHGAKKGKESISAEQNDHRQSDSRGKECLPDHSAEQQVPSEAAHAQNSTHPISLATMKSQLLKSLNTQPANLSTGKIYLLEYSCLQSQVHLLDLLMERFLSRV